MLPPSLLSRLADTALEGTIVGSFTKIGSGARRTLFDWGPAATDMTGKTVLLTGGSSGLGKETARQLVAAGATVHLTSRTLERAEQAADEIDRPDPETGEPTGNAIGAELDTGDFDSIGALVEGLANGGVPLDVLIHNAGALTNEYRTNEQGMELTLASHLVGPYALTRLLDPLLTDGARILWMASGGLYTQRLDVDHIEMSEADYRGAIAYARAKRGQVEMVRALAPEWAPKRIMHSMHPGWVDTEGVAQGLPGFGAIMGPLLRDVQAGADTMVWLACGGADDAEPGQFWLDRRPRSTSYLPGTGTSAAERRKLIEWLDLVTLPAVAGHDSSA